MTPIKADFRGFFFEKIREKSGFILSNPRSNSGPEPQNKQESKY